jgi:pilin isopeptide linkage protein
MGTHTYVIAEVAGEDRTITYTTETATVVVTVSDDGNGGVKAEITSCETTLAVDDDGVITFVNTYTKPKQTEPSYTVKPDDDTEQPEEDTSSEPEDEVQQPEEDNAPTPETPVVAPGKPSDGEVDTDEEEAETPKKDAVETEPSDSEPSDSEPSDEEAAPSPSDDKEVDSAETTDDFESEQITTEKAEAISNPTTGDSSHVILWVISAGVSAVVAGAVLMVIVMMRKRS